jgi:hypothetical protein
MQKTNLSVACLGCCLDGDVSRGVGSRCTISTVAVRV